MYFLFLYTLQSSRPRYRRSIQQNDLNLMHEDADSMTKKILTNPANPELKLSPYGKTRKNQLIQCN